MPLQSEMVTEIEPPPVERVREELAVVEDLVVGARRRGRRRATGAAPRHRRGRLAVARVEHTSSVV